MIARASLALVLLLPAVLVPLTASFAPNSVESVELQDEEEEGNPVLHGIMEDLGKTLRTLGRGMKEDGAMATGLVESVRLQRAILDAKDQLPIVVSGMEEGKARAKSAVEYRAQMQELLKGLLVLELAYANEDAGKVGDALKELDSIKKAGHKVFKP